MYEFSEQEMNKLRLTSVMLKLILLYTSLIPRENYEKTDMKKFRKKEYYLKKKIERLENSC